jgi:hypothetical protein
MADDGHHYVVKFANNPLGPRVLVNEVTCSMLLEAIGVRVPQIAYMRIPEEFADNPDVGIFRLGERLRGPCSGLHFASALPCDPRRTSIFDLVPKGIAPLIENADHFIGVLVADLWLGNADMRQVVYHRSPEGRWHATFIDHGLCFAGPDWRLYNSPAMMPSPVQRHYLQSATEDDCQPWLKRICALPEGLFDMLPEHIPAEWLTAADALELERLLARLHREREFLHHRILRGLMYAKHYRRSF